MSRSSTAGTGLAEALLDGFVDYLRRERGVTELTVEAYVSDVRRFLAQLPGEPQRHIGLPRCGWAKDGEQRLQRPRTSRR